MMETAMREIGFDPEKTFIFSDIDYIQHLCPNVLKVQKHINYSQIKGIFGFKEAENIGNGEVLNGLRKWNHKLSHQLRQWRN